VVGRLDRENADFDNVLKQLATLWHPVVGCRSRSARTRHVSDHRSPHGQLRKGPEGIDRRAPATEKERIGDYQRQLVEAIVETNEDLITGTSRGRR